VHRVDEVEERVPVVLVVDQVVRQPAARKHRKSAMGGRVSAGSAQRCCGDVITPDGGGTYLR
jgi:hypothetical protein